MIRSPITRVPAGSHRTIREGRYVVPQRLSTAPRCPALSTSLPAVPLYRAQGRCEKNNELKRLMVAEKQEVLRILGNLTAGVARNAESIQIALEARENDFIMARPGTARSWMPGSSGWPACRYEYPAGQAPFKKEMVPVDIRIVKISTPDHNRAEHRR